MRQKGCNFTPSEIFRRCNRARHAKGNPRSRRDRGPKQADRNSLGGDIFASNLELDQVLAQKQTRR